MISSASDPYCINDVAIDYLIAVVSQVLLQEGTPRPQTSMPQRLLPSLISILLGLTLLATDQGTVEAIQCYSGSQLQIIECPSLSCIKQTLGLDTASDLRVRGLFASRFEYSGQVLRRHWSLVGRALI